MMKAPALLFNPLDPIFRADPYPFYARLRAEDPVHETPAGVYVLSRYAGCVAALRDPRLSSDLRHTEAFRKATDPPAARPPSRRGRAGRGAIDAQARLPDRQGEALRRTPPFLVLDPPDHTRLRGLVSKAFTPRAVEAMRPRIEALVNELLDTAATHGEVEFVEEFAYPLPLTVICEMLGVPAEDHAVFKEWSRALSRGLDPPEVQPPDALERQREAGNAFAQYFRDLITRRRSRPAADLLSDLIEVEEQGDRLTEDELVSTCIFLLAAGHETTVNLLSGGLLALLRHPDQLALLRNDQSLARGAVEELLRYDAPVQYAVRVAREDVDVGVRTIAAGRQVLALLGSANRDPDAFPDPDRLDITRRDNRHIAFGFGIHFCLGAPLARIEGETAFRALVSRFRRIELLTEAPEYKENITLRGLRSLRVALSLA